MRFFVFFILLAALFGSTLAQHPKQPEAVAAGLRGAVKSVETVETKLYYDERKRVVSKESSRNLNSYNQAGYETETVYRDTDDRITYQAEKFYDEKGRRDKERRIWNGEEYRQSVEERFFYDAAGRLIESKLFDGDNSTKHQKFTNDARGNLLKCVEIVKDVETQCLTQEFDDTGNLIFSIAYENNKPYKRLKYIYDKTGRKIEEITGYGESGIFSKKTFSYDAKGNLVVEEEFNDSGALVSKKIYSYTNKGYRVDGTNYRLGFPEYGYYHIYNEHSVETEWATLRFDCEKIVNHELPRPYIPSVVAAGGRPPQTAECPAAPIKNLRERYIYQFIYDARGNWTRKTTLAQTNSAQKPLVVQIEQRKIIYFPADAKSVK